MTSSDYRKTCSKSTSDDGVPQIQCDPDTARFARTTVEALARLNPKGPWLFRTSEGLARVETKSNRRLRIQDLTIDRMHYELAESMVFYVLENDRRRKVRPSRELAKYILSMPDLPFPVLRRIMHTPFFGPGGELILSQGYHAESGMYLDMSPDLSGIDVFEKPEDWEIEASHRILRRLLSDFPFTGDPERAHAYAALLLPFVRAMIAGPTPIHVVEKPTPGTGATLLIMAYGDIWGIQPTLLDQCRSDDEWSRRILAALRHGPSAILLDNITAPLDSPTLAAAVTADTLSGRLVGTSKVGEAPVECVWLVTGNNPKLSFEMVRRSVRVRIDAGLDRPDCGRSFKIPNLRAWIEKYRLLLVQACLTLVQAWVAAGMPKGDRIVGGFERWSEVMGGILEVVGIPGFLENLDEHRESADSETSFRSFLANWDDKYGDRCTTAKQVFDLADHLDLGEGNEQSRRIRLGRLLGKNEGRYFGPLRLERCSGLTGGSALWRLTRSPRGE